MAIPVAVTVVVTILCCCLLLTSAILVYKLRPGARSRKRGDSASPDPEKLPPVRKLCVERGRVVSAPPTPDASAPKKRARSHWSSYLSSAFSTRRSSLSSLPPPLPHLEYDEKPHRYPAAPRERRNLKSHTRSSSNKERMAGDDPARQTSSSNGPPTNGDLALDPLVVSSWREYNAHRPINDDLASPLAPHVNRPLARGQLPGPYPASNQTPQSPPHTEDTPAAKLPTPPPPPPPPRIVSEPSTPTNANTTQSAQSPPAPTTSSAWPSAKALGKRPTTAKDHTARTGLDAKVIKSASISAAPRSAYSPRPTPRGSLYSVDEVIKEEAEEEEERPPVPALPPAAALQPPKRFEPLVLDLAPFGVGLELPSPTRTRSVGSRRSSKPGSRGSRAEIRRSRSASGATAREPETPSTQRAAREASETSSEPPRATATITDLTIDLAPPIIAQFLSAKPSKPRAKAKPVGSTEKVEPPNPSEKAGRSRPKVEIEASSYEDYAEQPNPEYQTEPSRRQSGVEGAPSPKVQEEPLERSPVIGTAARADVPAETQAEPDIEVSLAPQISLEPPEPELPRLETDRLGRTSFPRLPVSRFSPAYRTSARSTHRRSRSRSDSASTHTTRSRSQSRSRAASAAHRVRKRPPPIAIRPTSARVPVVRSPAAPPRASLEASIAAASSPEHKRSSSSEHNKAASSPDDQVPDLAAVRRRDGGAAGPPKRAKDRQSTVTVTSSNYSPPPSLAPIRRVPLYASGSPLASRLGRAEAEASPRVVQHRGLKRSPRVARKPVPESVLSAKTGGEKGAWPPPRRGSPRDRDAPPKAEPPPPPPPPSGRRSARRGPASAEMRVPSPVLERSRRGSEQHSGPSRRSPEPPASRPSPEPSASRRSPPRTPQTAMLVGGHAHHLPPSPAPPAASMAAPRSAPLGTHRPSRYSHLFDKALPSLPSPRDTDDSEPEDRPGGAGAAEGAPTRPLHTPPSARGPAGPASPGAASSASPPSSPDPARMTAVAAALSAAAAVGPPPTTTSTAPGREFRFPGGAAPRASSPPAPRAAPARDPVTPERALGARRPSQHRKSPSAGPALGGPAAGASAASIGTALAPALLPARTPPRPTTLPPPRRVAPPDVSPELDHDGWDGVSPVVSPERRGAGAARGAASGAGGDREEGSLGRRSVPMSEVSPLSAEFSVAVQRSLSRR